jgi:HD-like signal output (HDOD) protein
MTAPLTPASAPDPASAMLSLADVVSHLDDLPSLPAVVMELLSTIDQENVDIAVLARKVSLDQALTAKTLRFANSSHYGLQVKVTTIQQAITYLGLNATREIITAAALTGCFADLNCPGFSHESFWRQSIATAACARALARHARFNPDYAFTAGLLHAIGRLVLVTCFPENYARAIAYRVEHDCQMLEAERAVLGIDHVGAGLALGQHWNFSDTIRHAIRDYPEPAAPGASFLAGIVHVANAMVRALDLAQVADELVPPVSAVAWANLHLDEETCLHVFRETELQFQEMSMVLLP